MLTWIIAPALVVFGYLAAIAGTLIARRRKRNRLLRLEAERAVREQHGDSRRKGDGLAQRGTTAVFPPRTLSPVDREAFAAEWAAVERRFADDPAIAIGTADLLVSRVMTDRGYPMTNLEPNLEPKTDGAAYPAPVENYRAAHAIVTRHHDGGATADEVQQAMIRLRSLFGEFLGPPPVPAKVEAINRRRKVGHERAS